MCDVSLQSMSHLAPGHVTPGRKQNVRHVLGNKTNSISSLHNLRTNSRPRPRTLEVTINEGKIQGC